MAKTIRIDETGRKTLDDNIQVQVKEEVEQAKKKGEEMDFTEQGKARMRALETMLYGNHSDKDR